MLKPEGWATVVNLRNNTGPNSNGFQRVPKGSTGFLVLHAHNVLSGKGPVHKSTHHGWEEEDDVQSQSCKEGAEAYPLQRHTKDKCKEPSQDILARIDSILHGILNMQAGRSRRSQQGLQYQLFTRFALQLASFKLWPCLLAWLRAHSSHFCDMRRKDISRCTRQRAPGERSGAFKAAKQCARNPAAHRRRVQIQEVVWHVW